MKALLNYPFPTHCSNATDAMQLADRNAFNQLKHAIVRGDVAAVAKQLNDLPDGGADERSRLVNLRLPGENSLLHV